MGPHQFWGLLGLVLCVMGAVALLTAAALRRSRQPARLPLIYGLLALAAGASLVWFGR